MMPPPLPLPQQQTRLNLGDLKSQIVRKLGPEQSQCYFRCLNQLLAQKLSKPEFEKFCLSKLGREFTPLHNQLIRSILKNACQAKAPQLSTLDNGTTKHIEAVAKNPLQRGDRLELTTTRMPLPSVWSNGNILPPSPRRIRSSIRDRRIKDRPSPLGPNGKLHVTAHQSSATSEGIVVRDNGFLVPCDLKRPVNHHHGEPAEQPAKGPETENISSHDRIPANKKALVEVVDVEDEKVLEQRNSSNSIGGSLRAPLGIPFCHPSVGAARTSLPLASSVSIDGFSSNYGSGELCHTEALRSRMERIAEAQGLRGVTTECADLLNNGLDAYLKCLIKACVELVGARSGHGPVKDLTYKKQCHEIPNGVWPGNHLHVQSRSPLESENTVEDRCPISLHDFKVAMELNPQLLGEDWPLLLEKISMRSFEE